MNKLRALTQEKARQLFADQEERSSKTDHARYEKSGKWSLSLWTTFLGHYGERDAKAVSCFGYWLGCDSELAEASIETAIYVLQKTGVFTIKERKECWRRCKEGFKDGVRSEPKVKNPCNIEDANKIVDEMPLDWEHRIETACCVMLSVETGARACTVTNVRKEDVTKLPTGETRVVFMVTKGSIKWNHTITLSKTSRAAEFLGQLEHDISVSPGTLYSRFTRCCELAGYPNLYFCYHSLRSGFCCSAFALNGKNHDVMNDTAIVGGWVVGSRAHLQYFKDACSRVLVADSVAKGDTTNRRVSAPLSRVSFHKFKTNELVSKWSGSNYLTIAEAKKRREQTALLMENRIVSELPGGVKEGVVTELKRLYYQDKRKNPKLAFKEYIKFSVTPAAVKKAVSSEARYKNIYYGRKRSRELFSQDESATLLRMREENKAKKVRSSVLSIASSPLFLNKTPSQLHNHLRSLKKATGRELGRAVSVVETASEEEGESSDAESLDSSDSDFSDCDEEEGVGKERRAWSSGEVRRFIHLFEQEMHHFDAIFRVSQSPHFISTRTSANLQDKRKWLISNGKWPFRKIGKVWVRSIP